jgi:hypothetical protein
MCIATALAGSEVWSFCLVGFVFAVVGLWAICQLQGILSWLKQHNKEVDVDEPEQQRFVRFVGGGFILFGVVLLFGLVMSRW